MRLPELPGGASSRATAVQEAVSRVTAATGPAAGSIRFVPAWGTVELDRAEREILEWFGGVERVGLVEARDDDLLGARCRLIVDAESGESLVALLEPSTEGRLAAALARSGEGPVGAYLLPRIPLAASTHALRSGGLVVSRPNLGPFGLAVLVLTGSVWGPHVVLCDGADA